LTLDYAREALPGRYDLVASALSIHHLEDDEKQSLFRLLFDVLEPGGAFVNADQVAGPTPALTRQYLTSWRRHARAAGASDDELRGGEERMQADRPASLEHQLDWLRAAGFRDVDCFYKHFMFARLRRFPLTRRRPSSTASRWPAGGRRRCGRPADRCPTAARLDTRPGERTFLRYGNAGGPHRRDGEDRAIAGDNTPLDPGLLRSWPVRTVSPRSPRTGPGWSARAPGAASATPYVMAYPLCSSMRPWDPNKQ
jgi:SAM-dependent methyltransferase